MHGDETISIAGLRQRLQKTAPEGGSETYVGRTVRFFSIFFTKFLIRTKFTPNQLTVLSVIIFSAGVSLFAFNRFGLNLLGVFLIYFSIIADACDGEVARWLGKNNSSTGGIYVEPVSHDIQYGFMFFPITFGAYLQTGSAFVIYAGFAAAVFKLLYRFLQIRFWYVANRGSASPAGELEDEEGAPKTHHLSLLYRLYRFCNRNIFSSVGLPVPLLIFTLVGRIDWFVYSFAAAFCLIFAANLVRQIRFISRLR